MDWLAQLCGLPPAFLTASGGAGGGVIQGTSSEAVVVALLAARARSLRGRPAADALRLVAYGSTQTHSCYQKACRIVGIQHTRTLPTRAEDGWALRAADLRAAMAADAAAGLIPCFLVATIGTTSSCAVDEVGPLAAVAGAFGAWTHVDAAYAGAASILPEQRPHFEGLEAVDSYSFNPHKWLLTNFDCCALWAADVGPLREALSLSATPAFLRGAGQLLDYKDLQARVKGVWRLWKALGSEAGGEAAQSGRRRAVESAAMTPLNSKLCIRPRPRRYRWAGAGARSSCTSCCACTGGRRCRRTCGTTWRWLTGWSRRRARARQPQPPQSLGRRRRARRVEAGAWR
jgi:glutamate/tyrosine decarboxylase-like PLP-dependent enzyme